MIKDLQKMMPIEDTLKSTNMSESQRTEIYNSKPFCRVVACEVPIMQPLDELTAEDEWSRCQEFEVTQDDLKLRIDKFLHKIFSRTDASGHPFVILPKMVQCTLALFHSNVDVER